MTSRPIHVVSSAVLEASQGHSCRSDLPGADGRQTAKGADGKPLIGRQEHDWAWLQFLGAMEGGEVMSTEEFLQARLENSEDCSEMTCQLDVATVPTKRELEGVYRTVPVGKAAGLDGLPPEIFKYAATDLADLYFPLVLKSTLQIQQPIHWKGGILFQTFKQSGLQELMDNYRSLYISSLPGKLMHRVLRQKFAGEANQGLYGLHCGAKAGSPVTTPSLALHLLKGLAKERRLSAAIIFLDTKTAYYAVARELAMGPIYEDGFTVSLFQRFGLPGEDLGELMQLVKDGGTFKDAGASDHMNELVKSIYQEHLQRWLVCDALCRWGPRLPNHRGFQAWIVLGHSSLPSSMLECWVR